MDILFSFIIDPFPHCKPFYFVIQENVWNMKENDENSEKSVYAKVLGIRAFDFFSVRGCE